MTYKLQKHNLESVGIQKKPLLYNRFKNIGKQHMIAFFNAWLL